MFGVIPTSTNSISITAYRAKEGIILYPEYRHDYSTWHEDIAELLNEVCEECPLASSIYITQINPPEDIEITSVIKYNHNNTM